MTLEITGRDLIDAGVPDSPLGRALEETLSRSSTATFEDRDGSSNRAGAGAARRAGHRVDLPGRRAVFSTRRGGVSEGPYESLNLGILTGDETAGVGEPARPRRTSGLDPGARRHGLAEARRPDRHLARAAARRP